MSLMEKITSHAKPHIRIILFMVKLPGDQANALDEHSIPNLHDHHRQSYQFPS